MINFWYSSDHLAIIFIITINKDSLVLTMDLISDRHTFKFKIILS